MTGASAPLRGFTHRGRPLVIGHRGVRRPGVVENTLLAFTAAADEGAEAIELDVRTCATGDLVVLHDPTLERVSAGAFPDAVADLSLAELSRIPLPGGARIPTLTEVLHFARDRRLSVNIELKRDVPSRSAVLRAAARILHRWDPAHPVLVSSFDPAMLAAFAALAPHVPRAVLVHRTRWHRLHAGAALPVGAVAVHLVRTLTQPPLLAWLKARKLTVNVWTVNDPAEARDLAALGVGALISDVPGEVRAALER
jgi:glycerophosphoryl diester phosphodiesterase